MANETVARKIYFFRLEVLPREDGSVPEFSIRNALSATQRLRFERTSTGPSSRYADTQNGLLCLWPELAANKVRVQFGRVRRDNLPSLDDGGQIKPLPIDPTDGIVELVHLQFFSKMIVGAEFNFFGPRATAFPLYFETKFPSLPKFRLRPLINDDVLRHLDELGELTMLDIRIQPSEASLLASASQSLPAAMRATADQAGADTIEIILKSERGKGLAERTRQAIRRIFSASDDPLGDFETFRVGGRVEATNKAATFDFLADKFVSSVQVTKMTRSRSVQADAMFHAIEQAYNTMKEELENAVSIGLGENS